MTPLMPSEPETWPLKGHPKTNKRADKAIEDYNLVNPFIKLYPSITDLHPRKVGTGQAGAVDVA